MEKTDNYPEEILGDGLFPDQIGTNIKVVSVRDAILSMYQYADQEIAKYKAVIEKLLPLAEAGSAYYRQNAGFDWVAEKDKSKIIIYRAKKLIEK